MTGRVVYVGHVPYDMTEEQIEDIFRSAGPVQATRLVFDRATGKSKGFAFVQYFEPESAASAVRNLDNHKVGNMQLKVNFSSGRFPERGRQDDENPQEEGVIPEIVDIVSRMSPAEKKQMLVELKQFPQPDALQKFLEETPQAAYAIVQCMFEMGLVDGSVAGSLVVDQPANGPVQPPQTTQQRRWMPRQTPHSTPQPQSQSPQPMPLTEDHKHMYRQIMSLTPDQLNAMPVEQRMAALQIRTQLESGAIPFP